MKRKKQKRFCLVCVTARQKNFEKVFFEDEKEALEKFESLVQQWRAKDRKDRGPYELVQLFDNGNIVHSRAMPWLQLGMREADFAKPRLIHSLYLEHPKRVSR